MQKNWYAVYTKPQCEKKVTSAFAKKKIDFFLPQVYLKTKTFRRHKFVLEPLFKSIVFVCISHEEVTLVKQINGVINFLFWLNKPAIIPVEEITLIKELLEDYQNIKVEPAILNNQEVINGSSDSSVSIDGRLYIVTPKTVKINLPTLGYSLVAQAEEEGVFDREVLAFQNYKFAHS